ncbi:type IV pilus modification protein PilV [Candidatus Parabeggiatoa sp. HSG14]|uniref:type IV pilus modification protein PilV n=1 Tax=Candidatus Parabeggiatoa sp. HSG14 TaxID=3055593 RepID=UPI0025A7816C|nr:type IV pilus modification protein PilV [Thiotrichales bacterium HSG14]
MLKQTQKLSSGFTLLEILVALLIVSIGFLGVATLQIRGYQFNHAAYSRTQAVFLASDIMDRMRVNAEEARKGSYSKECPQTDDVGCDGNNCSSEQLAVYDLAKWCNSLQNTLKGEVNASIQGNASNNFTITISWKKPREKNPERQVWQLQL